MLTSRHCDCLDFYIWDFSFAYFHVYNNITPKQVKNDISYALNSRVEEKTIKNFEKVFGFEYDEYLFTNKTIIEEVCRVVS